MKRWEAIQAGKDARKPIALHESDFLLGVCDATRMGALRFSLSENGEFLATGNEPAAPPWTALRALESASLAFENSGVEDEEKWLRRLLAPGSSLGGARPKATVLAPDCRYPFLRNRGIFPPEYSISKKKTEEVVNKFIVKVYRLVNFFIVNAGKQI